MTKHTPGPWTQPRVYKNAKGKPLQAIIYGGASSCPSGSGLQTIAVIDLVANGGAPSLKKFLANARLIAAAPDLLAASLEASKLLLRLRDRLVIGDAPEIRTLKAAIAKATKED